jgi:hypothetical protein
MQTAHQQLLELAEALHSAAAAGDEEEVVRLAIVSLRELAIHLGDERLMDIELDALEPDLAADLQHRQRQVVERLLALADEPGLADDECRCAALADDVVALLDEEVTAEEAAIETYHLPASGPRATRRPPRSGA